MKRFVFGVAMLLLAMVPASAIAATHRIALLNSSTYAANFMNAHYANCGGGGNVHVGGDEYKRYYLGWEYVLKGELNNGMVPGSPALPANFPPYVYEIITDSQLSETGLTRFDILILSNDVSLSDDQDKAVQLWVLKGGRLIATYGSGYKDIITDADPRQIDGLKLQSGGTSGIHQLWHDPLTKAFGTQSITKDDPTSPGIDVAITTAAGPTAGFGLGIMSYGAEANLLGQRQENFKDAIAFLNFTPAGDWTRSQPAILVTKASKGQVVYMAFAPEFIVSLAFDLAGHCLLDGSYPAASLPLPGHEGPDVADFPNGFVGLVQGGAQVDTYRVGRLMQLMKNTIDYMLGTF